MEETEDEFVTRLIQPNEQRNHFNQVESLTTKNITFLKSKFVSRSGCELVDYPMKDCAGIVYKDERPVLTIIAGIILVLLIGAISALLFLLWDDLAPGARIPVGAMGVGALAGVRWAFLSRRHRFLFEMKDGTVLKWKSRSGEYKYKLANTKKILRFAEEEGLLRSTS